MDGGEASFVDPVDKAEIKKEKIEETIRRYGLYFLLLLNELVEAHRKEIEEWDL